MNFQATRVGGAPAGEDAGWLAEFARREAAPVLHVARLDRRLAEVVEALAFRAPGLSVLELPAWDCQPYDRVSPNRDVVAQRIATLAAVADPAPPLDGPTLVLTSINAVTQRVLTRASLLPLVMRLSRGAKVAFDRVLEFLLRNGFERVGTVHEPGEFAVRGSIIDIFPPGEGEPLRVDFFGDRIEALRLFDPGSQRATGGLRDEVLLLPASEVVLSDASIARFRNGYRSCFGDVSSDPLYLAVTEGRRQIGMEHWLPLFEERLETLFDYLPDASVTLDNECEQARDARMEIVRDYYDARTTYLASGKGALAGAPPYRPLPPERLYLDAPEFERALQARSVGIFFPFTAPEGVAAASFSSIVGLGGRAAPDFSAAAPGLQRQTDAADVEDAYSRLARYASREQGLGRRFVVTGYSSGSRERLRRLLSAKGIGPLVEIEQWSDPVPDRALALTVLPVERGFRGNGISLVTEQDILGERILRAKGKRARAEDFIAGLSEISEGDLVVHLDHGIGRYDGLETLDVAGAPHDCLRLTYANDDRLYLPVENIDMLSRYGTAAAPLDRLGSHAWQARKAGMKNRLRDMADELIRVAADRGLMTGPAINLEMDLNRQFAAGFVYEETDDQNGAIEDTLKDLQSGRPMDRLICGDVGFGKTEVALRAAFAATVSGVQVAVVVPTTLLCRQHHATFAQRFAQTGIRVAQLSRLVSGSDAGKVRSGLEDGSVEIVIGTHALFGKSVRFANLGLVVVDEEQRFGVRQKEALKRLKAGVHVLTLSATPIPRTLQMALSGVRDLSLIGTPPVDRLAVRTFVAPYDPVMMREAILREHFRGGQTFYVCPRISDLDDVAAELRDLVPEVRIAVAHGRLSRNELEEVIGAFYEGAADLLLSTEIVESGLDIPTANTMIIHRADMYGLAQLYQLRGRIGRAKLRAYCYMLLPGDRKLTDSARKRLEAMQALDTLGAGFRLASHDLDIRGAGNLLGDEQSGHIKEVGVELYQHMLEEAMAVARGTVAETDSDWSPAISLGIPVLIPDHYVADLGVRLGLYRRLAAVGDGGEIDGFAAEMTDRFGPMPEEVENLLEIVSLKRECRSRGIAKLDAGPKGAIISFHESRPANPDAVLRLVTESGGRYRLRPDNTLVCQEGWGRPSDRLRGAHSLLRRLAAAAAEHPEGAAAGA